MQPDDERLPEFDGVENCNNRRREEDSELYAPLSSHRLTDVFYQTQTHSRHVADENAAPETIRSVEAIRAHIEKYIGTPQPLYGDLLRENDLLQESDLLHESDLLQPEIASESALSPVEIFHIAPTSARPFHTLVTAGMSDRAMNAPGDEIRYAELVLTLPEKWPLPSLAFDFEDKHSWPLQWLQILANLPREHDTWLGRGHTVPNGEPAEPFADETEQCCMILLSPLSVAREFGKLRVVDESGMQTINFYAMVPVYQEEMELKLREGSDSLVKLFRKHGVCDVVAPQRRNVCKKHRWF